MKTPQSMTQDYPAAKNVSCWLAVSKRILLALTGALVLSSGLSCAVAPTSSPAEPTARPVSTPPVNAGLRGAYSSYEKRDYAAAAAEYHQLANSPDEKVGVQRLAHLGNALVHLSTDPQWRELDAAGRSLQSAEALGTGNETLETSMLMDTLSALIGVESNISELNAKVADSSVEIDRLKNERETLQTELAALNEALEKLKALTIGN